ncbi:VRR-NUC domain-containing protein [Pseudodesulfovibrio tunisiensis]|uniref:VRR-NUC domain-containing protein n=1 Tax=Pseudodesulfovibrio tunisiensis TaxID=463192 RepID=UPI001FB229FB|nr:VRR-NUC domain-containing protein [Pseudodesulfovibrio tunisiensis]
MRELQPHISARELREMGGLEGLQRKARAMGRVAPDQVAPEIVPTEHEEQVAFFNWANDCLPPEVEPLLYAIPNGGHRLPAVAGKLKAEGVKPGVPDICLAWPRLGYHGLYIEMKRQKGGRLSDAQKRMISALRRAGYLVRVCKGDFEAREALQEYMFGKGDDAA